MNYRTIYTTKTDWNVDEEHTLNKAVGFANNYVGHSFFYDVSSFISKTLQIKYVLVGQIDTRSFEAVQTLGFVCDGKRLSAYTYQLMHSPCENVIYNQVCYYSRNIQDLFPKDDDLKTFGIQSYMGVALNDAEENRIGLIALMHDSEFENPALAETFITILSPRIEDELSRMLGEELKVL